MEVKNEILVRIYIVLSVIMLFALVILFQAINVVFIESEWKEKAKTYHFEMKEVVAERGNIISDGGSLLATSLPYYDIHFDPLTPSITDDLFYEKIDTLAYLLATKLDKKYTVGGYRDKLIDARKKGDRYILIKKDASHVELEMLRTFPIFNRGRYQGGLIVEKRPKRERPFGILAHRTIGYIRDGITPVGLEGKYDKLLGGKAGEQLMRKIKGLDGEYIWIPANDYSHLNPVEGKDIKTTLDINLQDITEQALIRGLQRSDAEWGTAILMDVKTGAIKAMANVGKTDDGWWEKYNHAVGELVEPGSTFKLASVMALLEDEVVDLDDTINLFMGRHQFYDEEMEDASYHGLEKSTLRKAFEISSNVGIAYLVDETYKSKKEKYITHLKNFNLNLPTGIEIDGEKSPYIKDPNNEDDDWSGITLPWMSIGYESLITPLQLATFYNAVANDGKMMKPYLVQEIIYDGIVEKAFKPTVVDQSIASPSTISKVKELLEGVVENGTAKKLKSDVYEFAGKTGTAQVNYSRRKAGGMKHQASFAGYFPAEDPVYTCIVIINDPKEGSFYGSAVAGPIFREIADKAYASKINMQPPMNSDVKPSWRTYALPDLDVGQKEEMSYLLGELNIPYTDNTDDQHWTILRTKSDTLSLQNRLISREVIPNVLGMGLRDAIYILENQGLKVTVSGLGKVRKQSVPAGRKVKGQTIHLTLS